MCAFACAFECAVCMCICMCACCCVLNCMCVCVCVLACALHTDFQDASYYQYVSNKSVSNRVWKTKDVKTSKKVNTFCLTKHVSVSAEMCCQLRLLQAHHPDGNSTERFLHLCLCLKESSDKTAKT